MKKINMVSGKAFAVLAVFAAAFTMASCSREQLIETENSANPVEGNCIITAFTESSLNDNTTRTALKQNDETGNYDVLWSGDDKIKIGGNEFTLIEGAGTTSGKFQGNLPAEDGEYTACYPATYNGTDWPNEQTYTEGNITGSPMTADVTVADGKVSGPLSFQNAGGILRLTVKGTATVKSITVSATNLLNDITLNCGNGVTLNEDGTVFHIAMPVGDYSGVSIYFRATDDNYCFKKLKEDTTLDIIKSQITPASFTTSFTSSESTDPLSGAFTVDSYGKQVCFSKGNLRYSRNNSGKWSFFDKQYKCGPDNYAGHEYEISLFTWGYDATQSINPEGNSSTNVSITSGNLSSAQDWGSVIADGNAWRTLTSDEWHYLFVDRPDAADKCGYATVDGKKGLIILPDEFTDPKKNGGSGEFVPGATTGYNANVYSLGGNWEAMEAAGAVFLPAAGRRSGHSIAYVGEYGCYWSSSAKDSDNAYYVEFYSSNVGAAAQCPRGLGCSVRLVKDIASTTKGHAVATVAGKATYVNWVQLWKNGPKFAEYNVGVTDGKAESYGGLYPWADNIASVQWGDNWRMPTSTEFNNLINNCEHKEITQNSIKGLLFTGKGDYRNNSLFFPYNGYYRPYSGDNPYVGSSGDYWSSTLDAYNESVAKEMTIGGDNANVYVEGTVCNYHLSVRAVLAE